MNISLLSFFFALFTHLVVAQRQLYKFSLQAETSVTTGKVVPFWMRSNHNGSVPLDGAAAGLIVNFEKTFNPKRETLLDWGVGFENRLNAGNKVNSLLIAGYGKIRLGVFQLSGGRFRETVGLTDTLLTSGSFSISGNALGVPKIELSVPDFYTIPFFKKFLALKGSYSHGWLGNLSIHFPYRQVDRAKTYLHQKTFYLRFGTPDSKIRVIMGYNHNVQWGNSKSIFSKNEFTLSPLQEYIYVVLGKRFEYSQVGNHLGSVDLGISYEAPGIIIMVYRQGFYDKDGLRHLANISDGINGISFSRKDLNKQRFSLTKIVLETVYSKNQAAAKVNRLGLLGYEDYYNNYIYRFGWSYYGQALGVPLMTTTLDGKYQLPRNNNEYFINNRLFALHCAATAASKSHLCSIKLTYSTNYGTISTSNRFGNQKQLSAYIEASRLLMHHFKLGISAAVDTGNLLPPSVGLLTKVTKSF